MVIRKKFLLALIPLSFFLGSCQSKDLEAAKSFVELSNELADSNKIISNDIYLSCTRAANWEALGTMTSRENRRKQLDVCRRYFLPNSQKTETAGSVLVNYVAALGNLATEKENGFKPKLDEISNALGELDVNGITINGKTRDAGVKITDFIANLLVRDFRRDNLKLAIVCTDKDIQEYSASLSSFIDSSYVDFLLNKEITQINEYYGFYIGQVNRRLNKLSEDDDKFLEIQDKQISLEEKEREEVEKVLEKRNKGAAYVATILATADFHGKLKRIFNDDQEELSSEQIQKCNEYRSEDKSLKVENINKQENSWNQEITVSELKQVKKVAMEYFDRVTPLLDQIQN